MRSILLLSILLCSSGALSQTVIDSLMKVAAIQSGKKLTTIYTELSWEYRNSNQDSALLYARKTLKLSQKLNYKKGVASAYNSIASSYQATGKMDSAIFYHEKSIEIKKAIKDSIGMADSYNNLGIIADESGNYEIALRNYFKALKIYENNQTDANKIPMVFSNIGIVYKKQKEYKKTLDYYEKALEIFKRNGNTVGATITKGNIGSLLLQLQEYGKAITYVTEAKEEYEQMGYHRYVPYMLVNRAVAKDSLKQHKEAQIDYELAVAQFESDDNRYEITNALIGYGKNQLYRNDLDGSKISLERALQIAKENKFKEFEVKACIHLAKAYASSGDFKTAYAIQEQYRKANDSLFEADKTKNILELDKKYQTEKKERELAQTKSELLANQLKIQQRNLYVLILGLGLVFAIIIGWLIVRQKDLKNRQLEQENKLREANAEIEKQNSLQQQRLNISRDLHDNIGSQLTFLISSLDNLRYAKQVAPETANYKLESLSLFTRLTINELRDTIWAMNHDQITFQDLQERLSSHIANARQSGLEMEILLTVDGNINKQHAFNSVKGMHIFRLMQEAINNAVKYSGSEKMDILMEKARLNHEPAFKIKLMDYGKGFDNTVTTDGNGLRTMKERAEAIDGTFQLESYQGKGTTIEFVVPC